MSEERALQVTDAMSGVQASLTILAGSDGGASAVDIELENLSRDQDLVLMVNRERSAFISLTVANERGETLSRPARKFSSAEVQGFDLERIAAGAGRHWRVPIAGQLDPQAIPEATSRGRLIVNVMLLFARTAPGAPPPVGDFASAVLTLYDMDAVLTRGALVERHGATPNGH